MLNFTVYSSHKITKTCLSRHNDENGEKVHLTFTIGKGEADIDIFFSGSECLNEAQEIGYAIVNAVNALKEANAPAKVDPWSLAGGAPGDPRSFDEKTLSS